MKNETVVTEQDLSSSIPIHLLGEFERFADDHGLLYAQERKTYFVRANSAIAEKIDRYIDETSDPYVTFIDMRKYQQEEFLEYDIRQEFIDSLNSE